MKNKLLFQLGKLNNSELFSNPAAILGLLWLLAAVCDCLWLLLDNSIPAWDQSAHLSGALNHWRVLQAPQMLDLQWWHQLWQQSTSYRGPFIYLVTVPFFNIFAPGYHQAMLVNLLFTAILLVCVYHLGKHLFTPQVGLWAAGLCLLFPSLAVTRTDYLLDYGIVTLIVFAFLSLTLWRDAPPRRKSWLWSISFGLGLGCLMLAKPTGFLFLLVPSLWLFAENLLKRKWEKILQLVIALGLAWLMCGSWYRQNWLTILTSAAAANAVGKSEGDPGPNTLAGWLYYLSILPEMVSWPILLTSLGSYLCVPLRLTLRPLRLKKNNWAWLTAFLLGAYISCSLATNKDTRFILPYLPAAAIVLARGLTILSARWGQYLRLGTVAVAIALLAFNLFPLPGAEKLGGRHLPYLGSSWPHSQVIAEVVKTAPYLRSNIGVLPAYTPQLNAFNMDFYGNLADFQVYARQLPLSGEHVAQDARSLAWYITKPGETTATGEIDKAQTALQTLIEQNRELQLHKTWPLPDGSQLRLYHRRVPPVIVEPITQSLKKVQLNAVTVPSQAPQGKPVPVTYEFSGTWQQLQEGLVLLTWQGETNNWLHDGAIGLGQLYAGVNPPPASLAFRVIERLSMLPPAQTLPGTYTLTAVYLNRNTGESYPLAVPNVQITLNPKAEPAPAPELDLITKLHQLSSGLSKGELDLVFNQVGPINQYDPIQDYLIQAEQILTYRLKLQPNNLDNAYTLALSQALQRRVEPLLETLGKITQLDAGNAYAWTYLGFVHLYNFHPQAAEKALQIAERLNPGLPEVKTLKAIASAMQLNLPQAWEGL